ncbi:adenosylmethionine--8-amino-7-oxononanoate transaminase [Helicobacter salomonis]|uniref:adenosylmethionine--8-amino-7-oxononanoate transaminase n=1 Tax=Helicobacter salomonis TaxID=56878 RepID=UPI000CF18BED|nr:adenosylmethionine--8-amino-7-oxononanoate transaminase [Helicobacter salomonis]
MHTNAHYHDWDMRYIWHPCSQMYDHAQLPLVPIKRAQGIYLYDFEDKAYIDAISSWWVNLLGHNHPYISQQLKHQIDTLEHVLLAGFTHPQIIRLSERLCALSGFDKCFYADNGSSCIEVALKMSFHSHLLAGHKRPKFLSLSNSYHGETLGALSISHVGLYKDTYTPLFLENLSTPVPQGDEDIPNALAQLEQILDKHSLEISAFILEPLIQCAGGMHFYSAEYVRQAVRLCQEHGVHVIFDEIAVGFGRTGTLFAYEQCGVMPDFLCLSKGISGGYLPLAVVLTSNRIYDQFYAPYSENKNFLHSHSYTGNALACACANATLDVLEQNQVLEHNRMLSAHMQACLQEFLGDVKGVANLRALGMIFAFELVGYAGSQRVSLCVFEKALCKGVLLRPLHNTIYCMPPYCIDEAQIRHIAYTFKEIVVELTQS